KGVFRNEAPRRVAGWHARPVRDALSQWSDTGVSWGASCRTGFLSVRKTGRRKPALLLHLLELPVRTTRPRRALTDPGRWGGVKRMPSYLLLPWLRTGPISAARRLICWEVWRDLNGRRRSRPRSSPCCRG